MCWFDPSCLRDLRTVPVNYEIYVLRVLPGPASVIAITTPCKISTLWIRYIWIIYIWVIYIYTFGVCLTRGNDHRRAVPNGTSAVSRNERQRRPACALPSRLTHFCRARFVRTSTNCRFPSAPFSPHTLWLQLFACQPLPACCLPIGQYCTVLLVLACTGSISGVTPEGAVSTAAGGETSAHKGARTPGMWTITTVTVLCTAPRRWRLNGCCGLQKAAERQQQQAREDERKAKAEAGR